MHEQVDVIAEAGFTVEIDDTVATITLSRPESLNSQTPVMWRELRRVGLDLPGTVRVVVVRAQGRAFSAGLDRSLFSPPGIDSEHGLFGLAKGTSEAASEVIRGYQEAFGWLARPDIVSIAVMQGHAIGAGFQLALACDLRIVLPDTQFCMAEPSLGLVPDLGGTKRLVELVGYSRAASICLTARRVGAVEAEQIGLVSAIATPETVNEVLHETVAMLLHINRDAMIETKALLLAASGRSQHDQEIAEREAQYRRLTDIAEQLAQHQAN